MLGTTLGGRYQICRYLGGGGFGRTYLAHDQHLPGTPECVVKQLKPRINHPRAYDTACRLFNREAEVLYVLGEHDQIPRLFAHFEEQQEFYLVQEFVDGKVLSRTLRTGQRLEEAAVIKLLKELLSILVFVHEQQVIHRDIKPSNLMRRNDGTLVMIDFGGVKQFSRDSDTERTVTTVAVGSAGYMPNEQLAGRPRYSSDIYATGMVALRAVTGCSPSKLPENIRTGEIAWRDRAPHISEGFGEILDRMTRYDFRERYATAQETLAALNVLEWGPIVSEDQAFADEQAPVVLRKSNVAATRGVVVSKFAVARSRRSAGARSEVYPEAGLESFSDNSPESGHFKLDLASAEAMMAGPMPLPFCSTAMTDPEQMMRLVPKPRQHPTGNTAVTEPMSIYQTPNAQPQSKASSSSGHGAVDGVCPESQSLSRDLEGCDLEGRNLDPALDPRSDYRYPTYPRSYIQTHTFDRLATTETSLIHAPVASNHAHANQAPVNQAQARQVQTSQTLDWPCETEYEASRNTDRSTEAESVRERGDQYFQLQQYEQAIAHYTLLLNANPDNYILWFKNAMALEHLHRHEEAIACYHTVLNLQPQDYLAWSKLGKALETLERHDEAVDAYTQVLQIQPQNYWAWHDQGRAFEAAQHIETAIASYERAIQLKPDFQLAIDSRKRLLSQLNQVDRLYHLQHYEEALQSCLETVETNPSDPLAWLMQGMTLENAQQYPAAIQAYDTVVNLDPTDYLAWFRRGGVLEKLGQYTEAAQSYRTVTELQTDNHWAWNDLGRVLETLHQYDQAHIAYEQALTLQESFDPALAGRDRVLRQFSYAKN